MKMIKLHEGKVKTIFELVPQVVQLHFSDYVTAGDGVSKVLVPGKGRLSQKIAVNVFRKLLREEVPVSFIPVLSNFEGGDRILSRYAFPVPIEVVCRGLATGSYRKRHPDVPDGQVFERPEVEFFLKDDTRHDPKMIRNGEGFDLMRADVPPQTAGAYLGRFESYEFNDFWMEDDHHSNICDRLDRLFWSAENLVIRVYTVLAAAWKELGFTLVDIKIEIGVCPITGEVIVIDAITPDEWRLWKNGDSAQSYDKDPFRKSEEKDGEAIRRLIIERYGIIAELTSKF